ncbi:MAG TPA: plastocyanin/azurin family copper-binding protein [Acidimicrobiales bacterium]|nr:plastocyanin/azurin family copper-binding protein [Acidimicrobiales bacterium]
MTKLVPTGAGRTARRRLLPAVPLLVLVLAGTACGGGDSKAASAKTPVTAGAPDVQVAIDTFMFGPKTVRVHVGDTVTWTNHDAILHTVTSGTRRYDPTNSGLVTATDKDGMFDMQLDGKGATAQFTFSEAGTFHYFCDRHPGMEADVEVS